MNKKTNLINTLEGREHEHVPVSFFQHFQCGQTNGMSCVEAHYRFFKETNLDWIKIMHDGLTAPCSLEVNSIDGIKAYRSVKGNNNYVKEYLERAKAVNEKIADEVYTYCNIFTPFTLFRRIGDERVLSWMHENGKIVKDALLYMAEDIAWLSEKMITQAGCLGCFIAMQGAEKGLMSTEMFEEFIAPAEKTVIQAANEASHYNILHFCGWNEIPNHLEYWRSYPGNTVNWAIYVENLSLAKGRQYFNGKNVMGGFDNRRDGLLYNGTRAEIVKETEHILDEYKKIFGNLEHLMIGGDCSFRTDFERERFNWVTEAVYNYEEKQRNN